MNKNSPEHYKKIVKIITSKNKPLSAKLAKILSYIVNYVGIDKKKYFITGSYALKDYVKYREIDNLDVNMDPTEFKKLVYFGYGSFKNINGENMWNFDLKNVYNQENIFHVKNFIIKIYEIPSHEGHPNKMFSLDSLMLCGLQVDEYNNNYLTIKMLYNMKKILNRKIDERDIRFIQKNKLLESNNEKQCGGERKEIVHILNYIYHNNK